MTRPAYTIKFFRKDSEAYLNGAISAVRENQIVNSKSLDLLNQRISYKNYNFMDVPNPKRGLIKMPILLNERKALKGLRRKLLKNYRLLDFRIYGSKAKGTDMEDSDLDVMIVLEELTPQIESKIDDLVFKVNLEYGCLITPLYFGREELEVGPLSESPVYKKALQEGISL